MNKAEIVRCKKRKKRKITKAALLMMAGNGGNNNKTDKQFTTILGKWTKCKYVE